MIISTLSSVLGGYLLRDVINVVDASMLPENSAWLRYFMSSDGGEVTVQNRISCLILILVILGAIYLVGIVCSYVQSRLMIAVSQNAIEKMRNDLFTKLQGLPVRYFDSHATGELMSRFTNDIDNIDMMINSTVTSLASR